MSAGVAEAIVITESRGNLEDDVDNIDIAVAVDIAAIDVRAESISQRIRQAAEGGVDDSDHVHNVQIAVGVDIAMKAAITGATAPEANPQSLTG